MTVAPVWAPRAMLTGERSPTTLVKVFPSEIARVRWSGTVRAACGRQGVGRRGAPSAGSEPTGRGGDSAVGVGGNGRTRPGACAEAAAGAAAASESAATRDATVLVTGRNARAPRRDAAGPGRRQPR